DGTVDGDRGAVGCECAQGQGVDLLEGELEGAERRDDAPRRAAVRADRAVVAGVEPSGAWVALRAVEELVVVDVDVEAVPQRGGFDRTCGGEHLPRFAMFTD